MTKVGLYPLHVDNIPLKCQSDPLFLDPSWYNLASEPGDHRTTHCDLTPLISPASAVHENQYQAGAHRCKRRMCFSILPFYAIPEISLLCFLQAPYATTNGFHVTSLLSPSLILMYKISCKTAVLGSTVMHSLKYCFSEIVVGLAQINSRILSTDLGISYVNRWD